MQIIMPIVVLGAMGLIFGALLGIAARVFKVEKDERIDKVLDCLSGANCGGCGYAGCSSLAEAIVAGDAEPTACPSAKAENIEKIANILGIEAKISEPMVARVLCSGTCMVASNNCEYSGIETCEAANRYSGGAKSCQFGCCGLGTCVSSCKFGAISIVDGIACVDEEKCTGCGVCEKVCPRKTIRLIPKKQRVYVACMSKEKGAATKDVCKAACIGCKICEKTCENGAISVKDNLASIDYTKCNSCGLCAEKCPKKIIKVI